MNKTQRVPVRLSKRVVDGANAEGTRYTIFDDALKGFGLRVFPSGEKILDRRIQAIGFGSAGRQATGHDR